MDKMSDRQVNQLAPAAAAARDNQHLIHSSWLGATRREFGRRLKNELGMNPAPLSFDEPPDDGKIKNLFQLLMGPKSRALLLDTTYAVTESILNNLFRAEPNFSKLLRDVFEQTFRRVFGSDDPRNHAFWAGGKTGDSLVLPGIGINEETGGEVSCTNSPTQQPARRFSRAARTCLGKTGGAAASARARSFRNMTAFCAR